MKAVSALGLTLLSACASLGGGSGGSAPAGPSSYGCAAHTVQRLGYSVFGADTTQFAGLQAFTAVKRIRDTGIGQMIGEITVRVTTAWDEEGKMYVSPSRYEEILMDGSADGTTTTALPLPSIGEVIGRPPGPDAIQGTPPPRRNVTRRRLQPGPVAKDASVVLNSCTSGEPRMAGTASGG